MKFSALTSATALLSIAAANPVAAPVSTALEVKVFAPDNSTSLEKRQVIFGQIQLFSGDRCDRPNGVGGTVDINDRDVKCVDAADRHSMEIRGCKAYVSFYEQRGCPGNPYTWSTFTPGCWNINTGRGWGSSKVYCPYNQ